MSSMINSDADLPERPPRPRSDSDSRRSEIVRSAAELMDRVGYHNASMADIAAAAGLRKASLYYYFSSKNEILYWIHEAFIDSLIEPHKRRESIRMTPEQRLLEIVADIVEHTTTHRGFVRVYFENTRELPPETLQKVLTKRDEYQMMIRTELIRGIESGVFRAVDPYLTSRSLFGSCIWTYFWTDDDWRAGRREVAYAFWDQFMAGIGAQPVP